MAGVVRVVRVGEGKMLVDDPRYGHPVNPLDVALEHAMAQIERELAHRLDAVERVAVARVLQHLGDEWAYHSRERRW